MSNHLRPQHKSKLHPSTSSSGDNLRESTETALTLKKAVRSYSSLYVEACSPKTDELTGVSTGYGPFLPFPSGSDTDRTFQGPQRSWARTGHLLTVPLGHEWANASSIASSRIEFEGFCCFEFRGVLRGRSIGITRNCSKVQARHTLSHLNLVTAARAD